MDLTFKSKMEKIKKQDTRMLRLRKAFNELSYYNLPMDDLSDEIARAHKMRVVRKLRPTDNDYASKLIEACVCDQSTRSRLSEISLNALRASRSLSAAIDKLRDYLLMEYASVFREIRTKGERINAVNILLAPYIEYVNHVESLRAQAQLIIDDIDKASWALRLQVDALKIHNKPEASL